MRNERKNNYFFLKKNMTVRDEYNFCKIKKTIRKDIKNILINI